MPKVAGVYRDDSGGWYFKVRTTKDPDTGNWKQVTRRGFKTASDAGRERQRLLDEHATTQAVSRTTLTVTELVSLYLDDTRTALRGRSSRPKYCPHETTQID